ncbi:MAG: hypothetical protein Q9208_002654 [Pyrenodesmia sp. 3 TL-2023]
MLPLSKKVLLLLALQAATCLVDAAGPIARPAPSQQNGPIGNETALTLSNPYPIPNTAYKINFHPPTGPPLSSDVANCINHARGQIASHLRQHGDGPIPGGHDSLSYRSQTVIFNIVPVPLPTEGQLTYNDTLAVLDAFDSKMKQQGLREQSADVSVAEARERIAYARIARAQSGDNALQISLPNPYPMPSTPFSLDFRDGHGGSQALPPNAVVDCFRAIRHEVVSNVRRHGNRALSNLGYGVSGIHLDVVSAHEHEGSPLTYIDLLAILSALAKKMAAEGFQERYAEVVMTDGGEFMGAVQVFAGDDVGASKAGAESKAEA